MLSALEVGWIVFGGFECFLKTEWKSDQEIEEFGVEVVESLLLEWSLDILIWTTDCGRCSYYESWDQIDYWLGFVRESVITQLS